MQRDRCALGHSPLSSQENDIPLWLSLLILFSVSLSLFLALVLNSNPYLTSTTGYADGGDMYSHQVEALYLKELLQNGSTDLWFDEITLGYPFLLAYHPFPCLFTSVLMILTESCSKFGLELEAFHYYGLLTQAYGMATFPIAVGFLYDYVLYNRSSRNGTILLVILNFSSHAFFGIYLVVVTAVTLLVDVSTNPIPFKRKLLSPSVRRAVFVHSSSVCISSWWMIPLLVNFNFIGGLPWKNENVKRHSFDLVLWDLLNGEILDQGRNFPFITFGAVAELSFSFFLKRKRSNGEYFADHHVRFIWLRTLFFVTLLLFLGRTIFGPLYDLIPFHRELEDLRYLNGIHFCGLLLMTVSFSRILRFFSSIVCKILGVFLKSNQLLVLFMLLLSPIYLSSQLERFNSLLTVTEVSFSDGLQQLKTYPNRGRVLASKSLGSGGPWDLALIPHLTKKPGVLTYSRGYHDTLSMYYVEQIRPFRDTTPSFTDLMRLYNIRFVATSGIDTTSFLRTYQLSHLASFGTIDLFVKTQEDYGYFEFAHVPGAVIGELKAMREAVVSTTRLFTYRVLFAINPNSELQHDEFFEIVVSHRYANSSFIQRLLFPNEFETTWLVNRRPVRQNSLFEDVEFGRNPDQIMSRVLKEEDGSTYYTAYVEVAEDGWREDFYSTEHLILKVTYHPYWTCAFRPFVDANDKTRGIDEDWHVIPVHHVTPNLMSVVLPPGRHHVTCKYKNPFYQKLLFVLFIFVIFALTITELKKFLYCR
ncbi:uncharacterized protein [Montipora foliosa]|uniref:uncharacterized protein isoform X1 n=1 Tax=Montipora foliosa TaxID=591990 RepID=UPI0035F18593